LKDVVRDLSLALAESGMSVTLVLPFYKRFLERMPPQAQRLDLGELPEAFHPESAKRKLWAWIMPAEGMRYVFIESYFISRKKGVYALVPEDKDQYPLAKSGDSYPDRDQDNLALIWGALLLGKLLGAPDLVHLHDGHTAFMAGMMDIRPFRNLYRNTKALLTIHNAGPGYHQTIQDWRLARLLTQIPRLRLLEAKGPEGLDPLRLAGNRAHLSTVSPRYAQEILESGYSFSEGLGGHIRRRGWTLKGIYNGIRSQDKDPRNPVLCGISHGFDPSEDSETGKDACRLVLLEKLGLHKRLRKIFGHFRGDTRPLVLMQSRLVEQKGLGLVRYWLEQGMPGFRGSFLLAGTGDPELTQIFQDLARKSPLSGRFLFLNSYGEDLSAQLYAAADFFLVRPFDGGLAHCPTNRWPGENQGRCNGNCLSSSRTRGLHGVPVPCLSVVPRESGAVQAHEEGRLSHGSGRP